MNKTNQILMELEKAYKAQFAAVTGQCTLTPAELIELGKHEEKLYHELRGRLTAEQQKRPQPVKKPSIHIGSLQL